MIPTSPRPLYQTALKVKVSKWKCLFAEITDASVVSGFTVDGLVCARQKHFLILQLIDTLKSVAKPLCSCLSCSSNIPSLVSGKLLCVCVSRNCIESYRVSGRVFKLSCLRIFLWFHILVIPRSNLVTNEDYAFIGNRRRLFIGVVIRVVLSYIWSSVSARLGIYIMNDLTSGSFDLQTCGETNRVDSKRIVKILWALLPICGWLQFRLTFLHPSFFSVG